MYRIVFYMEYRIGNSILLPIVKSKENFNLSIVLIYGVKETFKILAIQFLGLAKYFIEAYDWKI